MRSSRKFHTTPRQAPAPTRARASRPHLSSPVTPPALRGTAVGNPGTREANLAMRGGSFAGAHGVDHPHGSTTVSIQHVRTNRRFRGRRAGGPAGARDGSGHKWHTNPQLSNSAGSRGRGFAGG